MENYYVEKKNPPTKHDVETYVEKNIKLENVCSAFGMYII